MTDLHTEAAAYAAVKARLLAEFPDLAEDDQALLDTLEGATTLDQAVAEVFESAALDEAMAEAVAARIKDMAERKERMASRARRKRAAIAQVMADAGLKKIEAPSVTLTLRQSPASVVITDEALLPAWAVKAEFKQTVDKAAIKKALADGQDVPGAVLSNATPTLQARTK